MPSIFGKSGSTASRAKSRHKSIRGTISAPIPIPRTPDADEFPIRNPVSARASAAADDEFPIRRPGTGIATSLPPPEDLASPPDEPLGQSGERELVEQQEQPEQPEQPEQQDQPDQQDQQALEPEHEQDTDSEPEQEEGQVQPPAPAGASPVGASGGSRTDLAVPPEPASTPPPPPAPPAAPDTPAARPASRSPPARLSPQKSSPSRVSPSRVSPSRVSPPARRATNPVLSNIRYSIVSDAPSRQTSQSRDAPQRKKSTLRAALGRLFGRGKKKNGNGSHDNRAGSGRDSEPLASAQHRSDPIALSRPSQRSPKRSGSLPLNEFDRPLRSHSVGPHDIMPIESARNSLQVEAPVSGSDAAGAARRATSGDRRLLRPSYLRNPEWGHGLAPRPTSAQGRGSRLGARAEPEDPDEIGRAITSDSGGGLRRRSRSLSGLQDLAGARPAGRRRSDEIRYWRESYDPGFLSPLSSNAQEDIDDTGMADASVPDSPAAERPPKTPPQPFNFGLLSKEMVGMKITHAANMDTRLSNLEARTLHVEGLVEQLCRSVPGFKGPAGPRDTAQPGSSRRSLETDTHSQFSFGEAPAYTSPLSPPSLASAAKAPPTSPIAGPLPVPSLDRPTSTSTVRGPADVPHDDLASQLKKELETERAARKALEAQVKKLSERVNSLSSTMFAMVRAPSESRSHERLAPSSGGSSGSSAPKTLLVPRPQKQLSVFETDDDDDDGNDDDDDDDGGVAKAQSKEVKGSLSPEKTELDEAEVTDDDFQTPREEKTPLMTYGVFGEELSPDDEDDDGGGGGGDDEDDPKRKKAARTLSLSQLTLGKGQRIRI